ncbi:sigma-70 family RNA polymerase sigma factor [Nocardioides sp.]|uniref:RNA polymerase sigma factor n=1 Tax=Nocardioides sp. TaxID=35761 RepID=UPI0026104576|nr:sigma-70 family RNA polymerase sigma factor [Nocardioides sp.]
MRAARFRALYDANFDGLLAFALRRTPSAEDAADVVSETFLAAWRRLDDVPEGDARLWLFGAARRVMANRRRAALRRDRLGSRLRSELAAAVPDHAERIATTTDVMRALRALSEKDREVLELSLWEGLEPREIAAVLGIAEGASRARLSRAKGRLRAQLGDDPPGGGHVIAETTIEGTLS